MTCEKANELIRLARVVVCAGILLSSSYAAAGQFGGWRRRGAPTPAEEQTVEAVVTSQTNAGLADYLARHPEADADGDGILTLSEALLHRHRAAIDAYLQHGLAGAAEAIPEISLWRTRVPPDRRPPTLADVAYGPHERNRLDFWRAEGEAPAPVLVFIHGGGFSQGEKGLSLLQWTLLGLRVPVAAVSINYRYATETPFPASFEDAARAIQFIRHQAEEWNIDPHRIAVAGSSAGGMLALWLGLHDDLAQPAAADAIARQSTRVSCVLAWGAPITLDPDYARTWIGGPPEVHPNLPLFFGVERLADLRREPIRSRVQKLSPINHISPGDPPLFLTGDPPPRGGGRIPANWSVDASVHNARASLLLKEAADAVGVECHVHWPGNQPAEGLARAQIVFLLRHLGFD